jgi:excisionase family DNA binding protein
VSDRWPALLKPAEACEYLSIGETTLNGLRAAEEIKSVRIGGAVRYRRTDLDDFIERLAESKGVFKGSKRETVK